MQAAGNYPMVHRTQGRQPDSRMRDFVTITKRILSLYVMPDSIRHPEE
jgi:hypothetical protein